MLPHMRNKHGLCTPKAYTGRKKKASATMT